MSLPSSPRPSILWSGEITCASFERRVQSIVPPAALMFLILLFAAADAPSAMAQNSRDLGDASLQELLNTDVYSASKHEQKSSDAPSSVTVVTAHEIQKYGYRTLADILQSVSGFYITYDRDYSYVGVRGFGRLGDWNSRVLVLVDGHRINDNVLGQAMIGSEFLVDVDLIERVEIIRGPSSSLYGAAAFFAVVNVITRKAEGANSLEVSFEPASFGTYKGRATYSGHYKDLGLLLSATFFNSEGQTLFFPEFNTPANNYGITRNTDYENYEHVLGTLTYRGFTLQGLFSARDKGVPTAYFGSIFNDPRTYNLDYHQYLDLGYRTSLGKNWELTANTSYDQARLQAPIPLATGLPTGISFLDTYSFRGNWWTSEVKVNRTLWKKHRLTFGFELRDNVRQDQGEYNTFDQSFFQVFRTSWNWAGYAQDEFSVTRKLSLNAGLRYDRYSTFGGTTNPRIAIVYHPIEPTTLKFLYGTAFRAPDVFEREPGYSPFYESNLGLTPETIRSFGGVLEQMLGQHLRLSVSVFDNRIDALISLQRDLATKQSVYQNSEGTTSRGAEAGFEGRFQNGWEVRGSYSYARAKTVVTNEKPNNSPEHLGKFNLSVPLWQRRLFASLDAQYTSPRQTLEGDTIGGFTVLNGTLLGHAFGRRADLSASVNNLLNKKYDDPGRPEDIQDTLQQNGRSFRVKLTWRFGE